MRVTVLDTPKQAVDVEQLAQLHHAEFGSGRDFDVLAVAQSCRRCVSDSERKYFNCWIAYDGLGKPIGYLAANIITSFYSFRSYAVQEMWYVVPRARGTKAALALIYAFELWALGHNVERIYTQVEHDDSPRIVEIIFRLLSKLGYKKQGYVAVKVVNNTDNNTHKDKDDNDDRSTHRQLGA